MNLLATPNHLIHRDNPVGTFEISNQGDVAGLRILDFGHLGRDILYGRGGDKVVRAYPAVHQDQMVAINVSTSESPSRGKQFPL